MPCLHEPRLYAKQNACLDWSTTPSQVTLPSMCFIPTLRGFTMLEFSLLEYHLKGLLFSPFISDSGCLAYPTNTSSSKTPTTHRFCQHQALHRRKTALPPPKPLLPPIFIVVIMGYFCSSLCYCKLINHQQLIHYLMLMLSSISKPLHTFKD